MPPGEKTHQWDEKNCLPLGVLGFRPPFPEAPELCPSPAPSLTLSGLEQEEERPGDFLIEGVAPDTESKRARSELSEARI